MVMFNLHPYAQARQQAQHAAVKSILVAAFIVPVLLLLAGHYVLGHYHHQYRQQWQHLRESPTVPVRVTGRAPAVNYLPQLQTLLRLLGQQIDADICFDSITQSKAGLLLTGRVTTAAHLTRYLLQWPARSCFADLQLRRLTDRAGRLTFLLAGTLVV